MMFRAIVLILALLTALSGGLAQSLPAPRRIDLNECLERALSKHSLIAAARARVTGAQEMRRYAGLRPNPSLTVQTENWRFTGAPAFTPARDLDLFIYGTQTFETAGKAARRAELAESGVDLAGTEVRAVRWRIQQEVTRSYYRALQAQTALEIVSENRLNLDRLVEYTALRVREGFSAEADLIRARLEQQTIVNAEAAAAQEFERARLELLRVVGEQNFDTDFTVAADEALVASPPPLDLLNREAMERRPDLLALRAKLAQTRAALRLAQAEARPDWDVSFGYKRTGGYNTMIAAVSIPLPIFNRKLGAAGQAAAEVAAIEQELTATENYIRAEIAAAHRAASGLARRIEAMRKDYLPHADDSRAIALVAYREGVNDLYKLLDAQRARNEARLLYFRAKYEFQLALAELSLAAGGERQ